MSQFDMAEAARLVRDELDQMCDHNGDDPEDCSVDYCRGLAAGLARRREAVAECERALARERARHGATLWRLGKALDLVSEMLAELDKAEHPGVSGWRGRYLDVS